MLSKIQFQPKLDAGEAIMTDTSHWMVKSNMLWDININCFIMNRDLHCLIVDK
jgi:hypothetical protein